MPAMRVILVRIFPHVFGGTSYNKSTGGGYYASNSHKYVRSGGGVGSGGGGAGSGSQGMPAAGSAAVRSVARGGDDEAPVDAAGIVFSRSYTVKYAGAGESDEAALVQMADLDGASAAESFEMKAPSPTQQRLR